MKRINMFISVVALFVFAMASQSWAIDAQLTSDKIMAGDSITVTGSIDPGQELFVVVATEKMFKPDDAGGPKERKELKDGKGGKNAFGDTSIPPVYYVVTSAPSDLATPTVSTKGQTSGIFAFPPFKYEVRVNKIKPWGKSRRQSKVTWGQLKTKLSGSSSPLRMKTSSVSTPSPRKHQSAVVMPAAL